MYLHDHLWIIIPAFNEEKYIGKCLEGLSYQSDKNFRVVMVDNASTDNTTEIARQVARQFGIKLDIIKESQKGTGWACRAGFNFAIKRGAVILARTDADCIPDKNWVRELRKLFAGGYEFIGGLCKPEQEDSFGTKIRFQLMYAIIRYFIYTTRLRKGFRSRFMISPGANLAITAKLYDEVGGFSKTSIETNNEDIDLANRVLTVTNKVLESKKTIVYTSSRRITALGLKGTFRWYANKTGQADIRSVPSPKN